MADRDEIAFADEQMRLAERDAAVDQLRRPRHDEQAVAILFDLGPLMGVIGVLDGEIVQVELLLHAGQERQIRFVQPDPDHVTGLAAPARRLIDGDIGDAPAVDIDAGGDNAFGGDRIGRGGRLRHNIHGFNPEMLLSHAPTQGISARLALENPSSIGYLCPIGRQPPIPVFQPEPP